VAQPEEKKDPEPIEEVKQAPPEVVNPHSAMLVQEGNDEPAEEEKKEAAPVPDLASTSLNGNPVTT